MTGCTPRNPCRRVTGPEWTEDQCRWCWRKRYPLPQAEREPSTENRQLAREGKWQRKQAALACDHRGPQLGTTLLQICTSGKTGLFPVFACGVHAHCLLYGANDEMMLQFARQVKAGQSPPLWQCNLCRDRTGGVTEPGGPACPSTKPDGRKE